MVILHLYSANIITISLYLSIHFCSPTLIIIIIIISCTTYRRNEWTKWQNNIFKKCFSVKRKQKKAKKKYILKLDLVWKKSEILVRGGFNMFAGCCCFLQSWAPRLGRWCGGRRLWKPAVGSRARWSSGSPARGPEPRRLSPDCSPGPCWWCLLPAHQHTTGIRCDNRATLCACHGGLHVTPLRTQKQNKKKK